MCQSRKFKAAAREGFSMMSTGSMRREPHCCWKLLLRLTCRIVAATALLLAANQIRATALPAVPASQSAPPAASALDIAGTWQGTLHFLKTDQHPQFDLRLVVKVSKTDAGTLEAVWYSIDQSPQSVPMATITFQNGVLKFKSSMIDRSYEGKMSDDGKSIAGTWMEGNMPIVLPFERATKSTAWATDPSKHAAQFVTVEPGVRLEVLDWGGKGRPLVLLTGLGNDAHVFDGFAEKLTNKYHVYGITRHGYGVSDTPPVSGDVYSANQLGDDVVAVIDKLGLEKPILVGHSIAGEELSSIGSRFPARVAGLIYLDAGYPYALYDATRGDFRLDGNALRQKMNELSDAQNPSAIRAIIAEMLETDLPRYQKDLIARQKELEGQTDIPNRPAPDKKDRRRISSEAIMAGEQKYTEIKNPVLAIFADPHNMGGGTPTDEKQKAAADRESDPHSQRESLCLQIE
jgi:non-heme chloroperoxidase